MDVWQDKTGRIWDGHSQLKQKQRNATRFPRHENEMTMPTTAIHSTDTTSACIPWTSQNQLEDQLCGCRASSCLSLDLCESFRYSLESSLPVLLAFPPPSIPRSLDSLVHAELSLQKQKQSRSKDRDRRRTEWGDILAFLGQGAKKMGRDTKAVDRSMMTRSIQTVYASDSNYHSQLVIFIYPPRLLP